MCIRDSLETMTELPSQVSHFGENLAQIYQHLLHQDVTRELAYDIDHLEYIELSTHALENEPPVRSQVKAQMERQLRDVGPQRVVPGETRTLPIALYSLTQVPGGEGGALRLLILSVIIAMLALLASELMARRVRARLQG